MFYITEVEDHVRVEPKLFGLSTRDACGEPVKRNLQGLLGMRERFRKSNHSG